MRSDKDANGQLMADVLRWDVVNWSRHAGIWEAAIRRLAASFVPADTRVRPIGLEIGADWGGGLALWMAMHGLDVVSSHYNPTGWTGSDTSYADEATRVLTRYGVADRVRFAQLDMLNMPDEETYDVIMVKSVLGGLGEVERQRHAVLGIYAALRDGGVLLFAENMRATPIHAALRSIKRGRSWHYPRLTETRAILSPFSEVIYETTGVLAAFGIGEAQRRWLGRADGALSRVTPQSWHYICLGAAVK